MLMPGSLPATAALPVLYSFRRCPYAMRARLALAISGLSCELREVVLKNKPAELLQASPKASVPVLVLPSGQVIEQSLDIMLWALAQHDPAQWLRPQHGTPADMQTLISACDSDFKHHLDRYKYPNRHPGAEAALHRQAASDWLQTLEALLQRQQPGLYGRTSLADMAIGPFVRQFAHTDPVWFDSQPWPRLRAWLVDFETSALFTRVMTKYAPWQSGSAGEVFAPQGTA
jgi:glutathione S-transferase